MEHTGFEPVTSTMRMLRAPSCANAPWRSAVTAMNDRADNGNRTRLSSLGSWCSTNELYLHANSLLL